MKKIILLLILPILVRAQYGLVYNGDLSPEQKYNEALMLLQLLPIARKAHVGDKTTNLFERLHERYLRESADAGYVLAIEWLHERSDKFVPVSI